MSQPKVVAMMGVGPGLGAAIAHRFADEGFSIALMARNIDSLVEIQATLPPLSIIDGMINTAWVRSMVPDWDEHTFLKAEAIAEAYWQLYKQDRTAWTLELDLCPSTEKF